MQDAPKPSVVCLSLWRNDLNRHLHHRIRHLLAKTGVSRWVWVVGDESPDEACETDLRLFAGGFPDKDIRIIAHDTGIVGDDPNTRLRRLSETANVGLDAILDTDTHLLMHESDLESPVDIAERFLATGKDVVGGWVLLGDWFYDTFATRGVDDKMFINGQKRPDSIFEVHSVGSCWLAPAAPFTDFGGRDYGIRCERLGVVDIMRQLRSQGLTVWLDPTIAIVQPVELWESMQHADE